MGLYGFRAFSIGIGVFRAVGIKVEDEDPPTYRFKGSTLYLRGHTLLVHRV